MAEIYEIKNRIDGLKSIHNITYAMQIVTISRLKRITNQLQKLKGSLQGVMEILDYLVQENPKFSAQFYPTIDTEKAPVFVLFFSNRGFCGSFNQDVNNAVLGYCKQHDLDFESAIKIGVGKKATTILSRSEKTHFVEPVKDLMTKEEASQLFELIKGYMDEDRQIYFGYFEFKSIVSQKVVVNSFYPPSPADFETPESSSADLSIPHYLEPSRSEVEERMLSTYYYLKMFKTVRDSASSEFSQRFLLMKSAVDNVKTLEEELTMELNKERQRGITQEISEIISTFKALSKK